MKHTPPPGFSEFRPYPKQGMPVKERAPMKKRRTQRKNASRVISADFLAFIRSQPCACGCGQVGGNDPNHLIAQKWAQADRNDFTCVPMCRHSHAVFHNKGVAGTNEYYGINLWEVNRDMVRRYETYNGQIPAEGRIYLQKLGEA